MKMPTEINEKRSQIYKIDIKLIDLLVKRMKLSRQIGNIKKNLNIGYKDVEREKLILRNLKERYSEHLSNDEITSFFKTIFDLSIKK
ncbi:MAG: chorismate mutase, partial [Candidatus Neomarinimicrobiota bacterium]|nr:chorismate mutase [Candidatus Neomarinimicrobiota bacterium]